MLALGISLVVEGRNLTGAVEGPRRRNPVRHLAVGERGEGVALAGDARVLFGFSLLGALRFETQPQEFAIWISTQYWRMHFVADSNTRLK